MRTCGGWGPKRAGSVPGPLVTTRLSGNSRRPAIAVSVSSTPGASLNTVPRVRWMVCDLGSVASAWGSRSPAAGWPGAGRRGWIWG